MNENENEAALIEEIASEEEKGPLRRCLVLWESFPVETMIRFVVGPDEKIVPDIAGRLPGRGLWLSARADVVNKAVARNIFPRAARKRVQVPGNLAEQVELLLLGRLIQTLGLARRAGAAISGFDKVKMALKSGQGGVVFAASDGGADGKNKLEALAGGRSVVALLNRTELGRAFGREDAVHALALKGAFTKKLLADSGRLAGFRG